MWAFSNKDPRPFPWQQVFASSLAIGGHYVLLHRGPGPGGRHARPGVDPGDRRPRRPRGRLPRALPHRHAHPQRALAGGPARSLRPGRHAVHRSGLHVHRQRHHHPRSLPSLPRPGGPPTGHRSWWDGSASPSSSPWPSSSASPAATCWSCSAVSPYPTAFRCTPALLGVCYIRFFTPKGVVSRTHRRPGGRDLHLHCRTGRPAGLRALSPDPAQRRLGHSLQPGHPPSWSAPSRSPKSRVPAPIATASTTFSGSTPASVPAGRNGRNRPGYWSPSGFSAPSVPSSRVLRQPKPIHPPGSWAFPPSGSGRSPGGSWAAS